jgi:hypothetical protein
MKAVVIILLLVVFHGLSAQSQTTKNGKATASGTCGVSSHSGNNDTYNIYIKNCGIGKEQGDQILSIVREAAQNSHKIDEIFNAVYVSPEDDARRNLHGDLTFPQNRNLRDVEFLLTNYSSQVVHVKYAACYLSGARVGLDPSPPYGEITLKRFGIDANPASVRDFDLQVGGDGQNWTCDLAEGMGPPPVPIKCADVAITIYYTLAANPSKVENKSYRFTLEQGAAKWKRTAIGGPPLFCVGPNQQP